jgi:hypothetical protein
MRRNSARVATYSHVLTSLETLFAGLLLLFRSRWKGAVSPLNAAVCNTLAREPAAPNSSRGDSVRDANLILYSIVI